MEGGIGGNILDPGALEFYPSNQFGPVPAQIYFPYPPPPTAAYHPNLQLHHPLPDDGEPSRAVILTLLPPHIDEASVMSAMESFGPVRSLDSASLTSDGSATVHFYDLRSSIAAVFEIRDQHMRQQSLLSRQYGVVPANWGVLEWPSVSTAELAPFGRGLVGGQAVWAQFGSRGVDGPNQGSIFISNCDPSLPSAYLAQLFGSLGDVKEVKETIWKPHQRYIEFYDIRDAARAVTEFNGKEVYGRRLVVEFSCTVGLSKRRGAGRHNRGGFGQPPPRLVRTASPHSNRWVAAASQSSSSDRGSNRKIGKSGREDKKGKGRHEQTAAVQIGGAASSSSSSSSSVVPKQQHLSRRGWKNHSRNGGDSRFQFKEAVAMEEGSSSTATKDSRTTVMIKNIPNKYSQMLLLRMLDNHCIRCNEEIGEREEEPFSSYDFVYLPIDFNNKCNVGYGFVNLTSPEAAVRLHKAFHMQPWEVFNSRKICQVNYARLQGLEALKEHFKNSKFACDTDEYMPVVFCPPRDGKHLTEPVPVCGRGLNRRAVNLNCSAGDVGGETEEPQPSDAAEASSTTASTHAPSDNGDGADDDGDDEDGDGGGGGGGDETASRLSQALLQLSYSSPS